MNARQSHAAVRMEGYKRWTPSRVDENGLIIALENMGKNPKRIQIVGSSTDVANPFLFFCVILPPACRPPPHLKRTSGAVGAVSQHENPHVAL